MRSSWIVLGVLVAATTSGFFTQPALAATDDENLTGLVYLADGTPLSATPWADNTSFAVLVNHGGDWATAWRYPAWPSWYTTSGGAYSIVLPAAEKDVNWGDGDSYRLGFDVSAITGVPGRVENATSHGTGDPDEFSPVGSPENTIVWNATDNWQRWDVVLLALPDLAILPGDVIATPPTVQVGQSVSFSATVRNVGNRSVGATVALFLDADSDRSPDPGEILDEPPFSLGPGETATLVRSWTPTGVGTFAFCAYADPGNVVAESDEGNNVECATVVVQAAPETRPDYVPALPQPPTPVRAGMSAPVTFSVQVRNDGNATATATATLAFFNETTPGTPFATFAVPPLAPAEDSPRFAASWTSPPTPGAVRVLTDVDHGDDLVEWNEANNRFTWTIDVLAGPVTNLVVGQPNVTAAGTYVTSATPLAFSVLDQSGTGIRNTTYRVDGGPWVNFTAAGPSTLTGVGAHVVEWFSEDFAGNVEPVANATLVVDDTPPTTTASVGDPKYVAAGTYVRSATPFTLAAVDAGILPVGLNATEYRIDAGPWIPYAGAFILAGEGPHGLAFRSSDLLGNLEVTRVLSVVVDDTPPSLDTMLAGPVHSDGNVTYAAANTTVAVNATEPGTWASGIASVECRIDGGAWSPYAAPFSLPSPDGPKAVECRAADRLGNAANVSIDVVLDATPPTVTADPGAGTHLADAMFSLSAEDVGSGLAFFAYRVDGGAWIPYVDAFTLALGEHAVEYRAVDNVGNVADGSFDAIIVGPSIPPAEANWKALVAAVFAVVLVTAGWRASWSRWGVRGAAPRRARLKFFATVSLPFVVAEAATGAVSGLTGLLSIPPVLGVGTAVDLGIFVAGLGVAAYEVRRWRSSRGPTQSESR